MVDYNPNIPQGTDNISTSQPQLLNNFGQLDSIFAADHYTWDDGTTANRGHHKAIYWPATFSTPTAPTGTQSYFYPKTISGSAQPYFINSVADNVAWYGGSSIGLALAQTANPFGGSMVLPCGLAFIWGRSVSGADNQSILFPGTGYPGWPAGGFLNTCFVVLITPRGVATASSASNVSTFSQTGFTFRTASGSLNGFFWCAIGN